MVRRAYPQELVEIVDTEKGTSSYVTREEFERLVKSLEQRLKSTEKSSDDWIIYGLAFALALLVFFLVLYFLKYRQSNIKL